MSTEYAVRRSDHIDALASLAAHLGCTIREAERRLADGTAADEIRRTQPPRRGIAGHLAYALIMRRRAPPPAWAAGPPG